ncbi:MAG: Ig-like domain-containing protein, partial [Actinomycetia bacterium]|nr:Ig-like domain-containing protein [Actinomycetes bacterium]
ATVVGTTWSCDATLPDGDSTLTATQTDPAGNESVPSEPITVTVDTTAPSAPVITGPADGADVNTGSPTISGTGGEPGNTVTVSDGATTVCTATVQPNGSWSCTPDAPLGDGDHTLTATEADPAGNISDPSGPITITVDTVAPAAPAITGPADGTTVKPSPQVSGTGEDGAAVVVTDQGGRTVCTAVVAGGTWSCQSTLGDGTYTLTATQTDPAGNASPASDPVQVTVSSRLGVPDPGQSVLTVNLHEQTVGQTVVATATVRDVYGNPVPKAQVTFGANHSASILAPTRSMSASCQTGADGTCSMTVTDLVAETDEVSATIPVDGVPVPVTGSPEAVTFTVGCVPGIDAGCVYDDSVDNAHRSQVKVTTDNQKASASTPDVATVMLFDLFGNPADRTVTSEALDAGLVVGDITRTGPGVYTIAYTTADQSGVAYQASVLVDDVQLTFVPPPGSALAADPAGVAAKSSPVTLHFVDSQAPGAPVITGPSDETVTNAPPVVSGTGEDGAKVVVSDEDGNTVCTATVSGGTWSCPTNLPDGDHTLTATQQDPAGNTSPASPGVTVTVDSQAPGAPVITGPSGGTVTNESPVVSGTGEDGATVVVSDEDGNTVCTATVSGGAWSCQSHLPDGDHTLMAVQTDPAGNASAPSGPVTVTIDTRPPAAPVITGPSDGSLADKAPMVSGTGEDGASVVVTDETGKTVCVAVVTGGTWSCQVNLPDGNHTLTATQTDPAGNESAPSGPVRVTVDTKAPGAPKVDVADGTKVSGGPGAAEPGATITVTWPDGRTSTATAGSDGSWSVATPSGTPAGKIQVTATDAAGNTSPVTTATLTLDDAPTGGRAAGGQWGLVGLAAGLLLAAGLVIGVGRRRRTSEAQA